jgi:NAD(P)-dependent dehydrogenase (short-subunit alcohol dehydrogenase family)
MAGQLDGKVALVTGGSLGIGRATALAFAREGAKVVIADVNVEGGKETVRLVVEAGGEATFVETDVSKAAEVEHMVKRTIETYGRLDCACNNAGIVGGVGTVACTEETWDRVIAINLKGVWLCMKYEIPSLLDQGAGSIVNMSSAAGLVSAPGPGNVAYVASKHGVIGLTKAAAMEYAQQGIRVNSVCPGWIDTPLTKVWLDDPERRVSVIASEPIGRVGTPDEIAEAVVWLCSDAASFVTGHAMAVDGGYVAQ